MILVHKMADYIQFKYMQSRIQRKQSGVYRVLIVSVAAGNRADWRRYRNSGKEAEAGFSLKNSSWGRAQLGMGWIEGSVADSCDKGGERIIFFFAISHCLRSGCINGCDPFISLSESIFLQKAERVQNGIRWVRGKNQGQERLIQDADFHISSAQWVRTARCVLSMDEGPAWIQLREVSGVNSGTDILITRENVSR